MAAPVILFGSRGQRGNSLRDGQAIPVVVLLVAGSAVLATLVLVPSAPSKASDSLTLWEASARGLATVTMVNLTVHDPSGDVVLPVGLRVTNLASVPITISEFPVLMSPLPSQSPQPAPTSTTQDAVLTNGTVPAGGELTFGYGAYVTAGYLPGPAWWCMEEMQYTVADLGFVVGGQTLPFALRPLVEQPFYQSATDNTQVALWNTLRSSPAIVVSKEPLWTTLNGSAGQKVRVRVDATNMAVWSTDDTFSANVNVTGGSIEDVVPAGWSVEEGSFSVPPDRIASNPDGSQTLTWHEDLPAAAVSDQSNPLYPTPYATVTRTYTLVSPALNGTEVDLPRAISDLNGDGMPDAQSAPVVFAVEAPPTGLVPDAGGPYTGREGDTVLLNASRSRGPAGASLEYRWSFTDNGTWDTGWSVDPTASARYTDEFTGHARVEITDGHSNATGLANVTIANVPPTVLSLRVSAAADFRLVAMGVKGHALTLTVHANGTVVASLPVTRMPGNPGAAGAESGMLALDLGQPISVTVDYTPQGPGQPGLAKGDNPAQLAVSFPDGTNVSFFHNFNLEHAATLTWGSGDLRPLFRSQGLTFAAHLHDPGSDGLRARWDFGDGTNQTQSFPNGPAGDAPEDVTGGVAPFDVTAFAYHVYAVAGTYEVRLTVSDPDGGEGSASLTVTWG